MVFPFRVYGNKQGRPPFVVHPVPFSGEKNRPVVFENGEDLNVQYLGKVISILH
jgi:hypothetical protein